MSALSPICPYCSAPSVYLPSSASLYGGRNFGPVWICPPCQAWVGCHTGTAKPLGRLADAALRQAKQDAHAAFDPLWQARQRRDGTSEHDARSRGYAWLAEQLGVSAKDCHIGMFDLATCRRVVDICAPHTAKLTGGDAPEADLRGILAREETKFQTLLDRKQPGQTAFVARKQDCTGTAVIMVGSKESGWDRALVCYGGAYSIRAQSLVKMFNQHQSAISAAA